MTHPVHPKTGVPLRDPLHCAAGTEPYLRAQWRVLHENLARVRAQNADGGPAEKWRRSASGHIPQTVRRSRRLQGQKR